ncbi:unnamed protein product [Tilletia controversa]|uniref:Phosphotransferase n=1 Tax=Tilletia controversa TaxID=13291 RepID=A0A8X7MYX0_9BASI|nr:hypothetical protein CF328_g2672 [Tilletia controversa]KAE8253878.1 hypothetical protein A4X06_0g1173 [Tilletia controversa]CAD6921572.1 unnamed protein product [Tilletia controversa]CAD6923537.1 unnamed protein product [Tilletia controversa]CAD6962637.1 unnamed protein product [Tilletia controversa]
MSMPAVKGLDAALDLIESEFDLEKEDLYAIVRKFHQLFDYGLNYDNADMAMIPSFVTGLPNGSEKGTYLALDLGGTNLRVCKIELLGDGKFELDQQKFKVSNELKTGPVADLFGYMAESVGVFLKSTGALPGQSDEPLSMGFTFSFPVQQSSLDSGTLLQWTKGFSCPDAVGHDVVKLLQNSLDSQKRRVRVRALVNDTVGALLTSSYQTGGKTLMGAIFGTGTNAAIVSEIERVGKISIGKDGKVGGVGKDHPTHMLINTEWGAFDQKGSSLPSTMFDNFVDRLAIRQRHHRFEKMISGMYLGEICRAVFLYLIDNFVLFQGFSSPKMNTQYGFDTEYMSTVVADKADPFERDCATRKVIVETMGISDQYMQEEDVLAVRRVCTAVGRRAARLSSVAVASVLLHTGFADSPKIPSALRCERAGWPPQGGGVTVGPKGEVHIGMDGSVVEHYPDFVLMLRQGLIDIVGEETEKKVVISMAKDGSGVGAALGALQAEKQEKAGHVVVAVPSPAPTQ